MQDRALVGDGHEVALVVGGALAEVREVARDVHGAHERVAEVVDVVDADAGHADHLHDDVAVVGELDAGGEVLQRRTGRRHQVGDHVHRLAGGRAGHEADELVLHLGRGAPVVVDALVVLVARGDDRALLGASGVLEVGARVVASLADRQELAGLDCLGHEAVVVTGVHDLEALGARDLEPVLHVLADVRVGESGSVQSCVDVGHRPWVPLVGRAPSSGTLQGIVPHPGVEAPGSVGACGQRSVKTAARFSRNAVVPSTKSPEARRPA